MPVCPRCEIAVEYKGGMVCDQCHFDFKQHWVVPWMLLNLKFRPERRTALRYMFISVWMLAPSLVTLAGGWLLSNCGLPPAVSIVVTLVLFMPVSFVTFIWPLLAITK